MKHENKHWHEANRKNHYPDSDAKRLHLKGIEAATEYLKRKEKVMSKSDVDQIYQEVKGTPYKIVPAAAIDKNGLSRIGWALQETNINYAVIRYPSGRRPHIKQGHLGVFETKEEAEAALKYLKEGKLRC